MICHVRSHIWISMMFHILFASICVYFNPLKEALLTLCCNITDYNLYSIVQWVLDYKLNYDSLQLEFETIIIILTQLIKEVLRRKHRYKVLKYTLLWKYSVNNVRHEPLLQGQTLVCFDHVYICTRKFSASSFRNIN